MKSLLLFLTLILTFFFLSCKEPSDTKEILQPLSLLLLRSNRATIVGSAVKGVIKSGLIKVTKLKADGSCDSTIIATSSTDQTGGYSVTYPKTGSHVCVIIGRDPTGITTVYDEYTGKDLVLGSTSKFEMTTIVNEGKINQNKNFLITPFSLMLARRLQTLTRQAGANPDIDKLTRRASKEIVIRFGLASGLSAASKSMTRATSASLNDADFPELNDILIQLNDPNSPLTLKFTSILVGMSYLASKYKSGATVTLEDLFAIIESLADDFSDGFFDGVGANGAITLGPNKTPLGTDPLKNVLLPSIVSYLNEGKKLNLGLTIPTVSIASSDITSSIQFFDANNIISSEGVSLTAPVASISYTGSPFYFSQNTAISSVSPIVSNFSPTSYSISPALPTGLTLNTSTGIISGTPTTIQGLANYTITATAGTIVASTTIQIRINVSIPNGAKFIFLTSATYNGNLGGVSGADSKCNADTNKVNASNYKAFLSFGTTRRACGATTNCTSAAENIDWVMAPNVSYYNTSGTIIATTNTAGIWVFPDNVTNILTNAAYTSGTSYFWSGIDGGAPSATNYWKPNNTDCTGWTSSSIGVNGYRGGPNILSSYFLENQFGTCDQQGYLLCVEQ